MTSPASPSIPQHLSDRDLLAEVARAAACERQATAHLIALLMELDTRRLYLGEGFSSLFTYCTQVLHLSEHAAYNRIEAARAARRFPIVLQFIAEGAITLTAVRLLAPHLTAQNHTDVLGRARHRNKRDVELLVAVLHPQADVAPMIRKLPTRTIANPAPTLSVALEEAVGPSRDRDATSTPTTHSVVATPLLTSEVASRATTSAVDRPRAVPTPIAPERYKIQFTVGGSTYEKLRRAQDLLRHVVRHGDLEIVFDRALTLLLRELDRQKKGTTDRPRVGCVASSGTRHVPAAVKRGVWRRDGGRCAFVGTQGRCAETGFLEYHHVVPFADGGATTEENLELRCRAHNQYEAERWFGTAAESCGPREGGTG